MKQLDKHAYGPWALVTGAPSSSPRSPRPR
jgi:hypothetical protein